MKKIWISLLLSLLIPGLGHIYIKNFKLGCFLIIVSFISSACIYIKYPIFICICVVLWIYALISCYKQTNNYNNNYYD